MQIKVNDISKIYGTNENKVTALKAASMTIFEGDFIQLPARYFMTPPIFIMAVIRRYRLFAAKKSDLFFSNLICFQF